MLIRQRDHRNCDICGMVLCDKTAQCSVAWGTPVQQPRCLVTILICQTCKVGGVSRQRGEKYPLCASRKSPPSLSSAREKMGAKNKGVAFIFLFSVDWGSGSWLLINGCYKACVKLFECKRSTLEPFSAGSHLWLTHLDAVGYQAHVNQLSLPFEAAPEYHQGLVIPF